MTQHRTGRLILPDFRYKTLSVCDISIADMYRSRFACLFTVRIIISLCAEHFLYTYWHTPIFQF